jgi:hypothetical protein
LTTGVARTADSWREGWVALGQLEKFGMDDVALVRDVVGGGRRKRNEGRLLGSKLESPSVVQGKKMHSKCREGGRSARKTGNEGRKARSRRKRVKKTENRERRAHRRGTEIGVREARL